MERNRMSDTEKFFRRLLIFPIIGLIGVLSFGLIRLFAGAGSLDGSRMYILLGSIVASATIVLFAYAKISDNWDKIMKRIKKKKHTKDTDKWKL